MNRDLIYLDICPYCGTIKNQSQVKLKHCPFCGSTEVMVETDRRGVSEVFCCDCGASVTRFHKAEAINAWNYRRAENV